MIGNIRKSYQPDTTIPGMEIPQIAAMFGVTHQAVSQTIKKAVRRLWRRKPGTGKESPRKKRYDRRKHRPSGTVRHQIAMRRKIDAL